MQKLLAITLLALLTLIPMSASYAVTPTPTQTPTPEPTVGCNYFQTGCGTPQPLPTGIPTVSIPTPTFIAAGLPPPPFPQIYDPNTEHASSPIGLTLTGEHITILTWDMVTYGVQMWNYYYNVMQGGTHQAIDAAEGVFLVVMVITLMQNLFNDFKPKISATVSDTRDRANRWAAGSDAPSSPPPSSPSSGGTP